MIERRQFLRLGLAGLVLASPLGGCALRSPRSSESPLLISAADTPDGRHTLVGTDLHGERRFLIPVDERCHGGCPRPGSSQLVLFARRPGRHFYVLDAKQGTLIQQVAAGQDHHFYGHGVFSHDGRYLYATENHYPSGQGWIGVYDAQRNYQRIRRLSAGGIGPHELRLHPDGSTLVVALGGIQTHPDYERIKLNLATMAPALLLMDRHTGDILQRHTPSHHQLSCRHLDISPDGIVVAGYQYQGPDWQTPPLIARLNTQSGQFEEIDLPQQVQRTLNNYTASIAIHPNTPNTLVTAPRGGRALLLNHQSGRLIQHFQIPDCAGATADYDGFVISSGNGRLYRITHDTHSLQPLGHQTIRWDNHLTPYALT
ncbi:MAG: DUF1513 domain-containing protein [Marinobacter sp.]|nr:DUF1513 domain-containing protein [Marinobacter sp.]